MNLYALDTDILTLFQDRDAAVVRQVVSRKPDEVAMTVISVEEQLSGWYRRLRPAQKRDQLAKVHLRLATTVQLLSGLQILSFTELAIDRYDQLRALSLNVRKMDLRIAAIALEHSAIFVTRNRQDFQRVPGLRIEDWSQ